MRSQLELAVSAVTAGTTKALPGRPGSAYCPRCGRPAVETEWEDGVGEVYKPHNYPGDGTVKCMKGSGRPVVPPMGRT